MLKLKLKTNFIAPSSPKIQKRKNVKTFKTIKTLTNVRKRDRNIKRRETVE